MNLEICKMVHNMMPMKNAYILTLKIPLDANTVSVFPLYVITYRNG